MRRALRRRIRSKAQPASALASTLRPGRSPPCGLAPAVELAAGDVREAKVAVTATTQSSGSCWSELEPNVRANHLATIIPLIMHFTT
jgi:hypothetical protein